ncbi:MAG: CpaF family protein [Acidimicrobiales bacterium]
MNDADLLALQSQLKDRVRGELVTSIQALEADGSHRLSSLDQEALTSSLVAQSLGAAARQRLDRGQPLITPEDEDRLARSVMTEVIGTSGRLQPYREDPTVISFRANDHRTSWVTYTDGRKERGPALASDAQGLIEVIRGLLEEAYRYDGIERRFDPGSPWVDAVLANGDRLFALRDLSREPFLILRRHNFTELTTVEDLRARGSVTRGEAALFEAMVVARFNLVIVGGQNVGKTTFLRCCANAIPRDERIVVLEDIPELGLDRFPEFHRDIVSVCTRGANVEGSGAVSMTDVAYRLHRAEGERFIVGEARGGPEVVPMLMAMTCGNEGSMTTVHAPSTRAAFERLALFAAISPERLPLDLAYELVGEALDFVIHLHARPQGGRIHRYVSSIRRVRRANGRQIESDEVLRRSRPGAATMVAGLDNDDLARLEDAGFDPAWLSEASRW